MLRDFLKMLRDFQPWRPGRSWANFETSIGSLGLHLVSSKTLQCEDGGAVLQLLEGQGCDAYHCVLPLDRE